MDVGNALAIVGILVAAYFGVRSMSPSSDMETLQRALRVNSQAMFNHLLIEPISNGLGGHIG
jgi:hypothetical protein